MFRELNEISEILDIISGCRKKSELDISKILSSLKIAQLELSKETKDIVAIDGSYSFMLCFSDIWLAVVRACALHYKIEDGFVLKGKRCIDKPIIIAVEKNIIKEIPEKYRILQSGKKDKNDIANECIRTLEYEIANAEAEKFKNTIIALDGSLTGPLTKHFSDLISGLITKANANNNILVGVSKDSSTHTFKSYFTDEYLLERFKAAGLYSRAKRVSIRGIAEGNSEVYSTTENYFGRDSTLKSMLQSIYYVKAPTPEHAYGDVYFAKLYPTGKWFRIDIGTFKDEQARVLSLLAHYANSSLCPGYVYPLLEAHRSAVEIRKFKSIYENKIINIASRNFDISELLDALTDAEGNRYSSFHAVLDKICK